MSRVKKNIIANFIGRGWWSVMSFIFIPVYIRILGAEAFGLIGLFATLLALVNVLDFGLSATMNRELAKHTILESTPSVFRDLVRTLEIGYWLVGCIIGIVIISLSSFIATQWLNADKLSTSAVQQSVILMGLVLAVQWPASLYEGGLSGLQEQVTLNMVRGIIATLRGVGSIFVLYFISSTIQAYFLWQLVVSLSRTLLVGFLLWNSLPKPIETIRPRFRFPLLRNVLSFATNMSAMSIIIMLLNQLDKVVLSRIVPLNVFGYYSIATTIAHAMMIVVAPISEAYLPKLTQQAVVQNSRLLGQFFHQACQFISVILFSVASTMIVFSSQVILLWSGDPDLVSNVSTVTSLLVLAMVFNASMSMLDLLQIASGWLYPAIISRVLALILLGPVMIVLALNYKIIGAALGWLLIYFIYLLLVPHFVFRKLLDREKLNWVIYDLAIPFLATILPALLLRAVLSPPSNRWVLIPYLLFSVATSLLIAIAATPFPRKVAKGFIVSRKYLIRNP